MFWITPEPARHRLVLNFDGSFEYDPRAVLHEIKRVVPLVTSATNEFDLLADFSKARDLPLDHARCGERVLAWIQVHGLRKCACVMVSATQRMVIERQTDNDPRFDFFLSRDEAEWWLAKDLRGPA